MGSSLLWRSLVALVLMIGFYFLAVAIACGLLYLPYAELVYAHRIHPKLLLGSLVAAGSILWSIVPRPDRFEAPGPELTAVGQPELFQLIEDVARKTDQAMPTHVYLVPDFNAFVTSRGGIMGFGSERVMGLGLPLLQSLTVEQLRGVIAHEFGHYHGGDVQLGPFLYKTRSAIGRTLETLGAGSWLHYPFRWYGTLFLRITHAISRAQEFAADRLAAGIVGGGILQESLRTTRQLAPAYAAFWSDELSPLVGAGYRSSIASGFSQFMAAPRVKEAVETGLQKALQDDAHDPLDTHPPLTQRLRALEGVGPRLADDGRMAHSLLHNGGELEQTLLSFLADGKALKSVDWDDVGRLVWLPKWRETVAYARPQLAGRKIGDLPQIFEEKKRELALALIRHKTHQLPIEAEKPLAANLLYQAISVSLADAGWTEDIRVGEPVRFVQGNKAFDPMEAVKLIVGGTKTAGEWAALIALQEVAEIPLLAEAA